VREKSRHSKSQKSSFPVFFAVVEIRAKHNGEAGVREEHRQSPARC
jgi:hypothetical protein